MTPCSASVKCMLPPLALHQPALTSHQLPEHPFHRRPAGQGVGVAAVGTEGVVVAPHRGRETGGDGFLADGEMAGCP